MGRACCVRGKAGQCHPESVGFGGTGFGTPLGLVALLQSGLPRRAEPHAHSLDLIGWEILITVGGSSGSLTRI